MMKRLFSIFFLVLACALPFIAQAETTEARKFVNDLSTETLSVLRDNSLATSAKEEKLRVLFRKSMDINWIGQFVLGRYARTATPEQMTRYKQLYENYLINSYIPNFRKYTGEKLDIVQIHEVKPGDFLVQTQILRPAGGTIGVDYRLRADSANPGKFLIYDIIGEGVSLIATQRSEFGSIISQNGFNSLLERLSQHNAGVSPAGAAPSK